MHPGTKKCYTWVRGTQNLWILRDQVERVDSSSAVASKGYMLDLEVGEEEGHNL